MESLNLPSGRRRLDLLRTRDGVFCFGDPNAANEMEGPWQQVVAVSWWLAAFSVLGLFLGWFAFGTCQVVVVIMLLLLVLTAINLWDHWRVRLPVDVIELDGRKRVVRVPASQEVAGEFPMSEVAVRVRSDSGEDAVEDHTHHWWVMLEVELPDSRAHVTAEFRLYGAGFRADMLMAAREIGKVGNWREVD